MKNLISLLAFVAIMAAIASCSNDNAFENELEATQQTLAIRVTDENGQEVTAQALVTKNKETISELQLSVGVNHLPVTFADDDGSVVIKKEGFEPYVIDLNTQTAYALRGRIIHVILRSILALTIDTSVDGDTYVIELEGTGSLSIIWPDGTIEKSNMPASFSKEFDKGSHKPVILKGDINGIATFRAFGYNTTISNFLGLKSMTNLQIFFPGNVNLSKQLDLTHNRKLTSIDLFNATLPHWLKLPENHYINQFTLSLVDRNITSNEVARLIDNIYKNAVEKNITGGTIALTDSDPVLPGTTRQIAILKNKYGWNIDLNL